MKVTIMKNPDGTLFFDLPEPSPQPSPTLAEEERAKLAEDTQEQLAEKDTEIASLQEENTKLKGALEAKLAERFTPADLKRCFALLLQILGKREAKDYKDVGGWRLDYNPTYGGANVEEIYNEAGGVTQPLGAMRRGIREFCETVSFTRDAIDVYQKGHGKTAELAEETDQERFADLVDGLGSLTIDGKASLAEAAPGWTYREPEPAPIRAEPTPGVAIADPEPVKRRRIIIIPK